MLNCEPTMCKDNDWKVKFCLGMLIACGIALTIVAFGLRSATYTWQERQVRTEFVKGNRDCTTALGAGVGVGAGIGAGTAIGGVGVACCGTGVGIPVGVVCLVLAGVCGVVGGGIGAAVGTPDQNIDTVEFVTQTSPFVGSWVWISLLALGILLILCGGCGWMMRRRDKTGSGNLR